jgi:predicted RNase H-like HicB family nuclease
LDVGDWIRNLVRLRVVLEPSDEGGFTIYVPALPGCISEGDNTQEALDNIQEAIDLYLEPAEGKTPLQRLRLGREKPGP